MADGIISLGSSGAMRGQIVWQSEANVNSNASYVTAELQVRKGSAYTGTTGTFSGYLEIGSGSKSGSYYGTVESDWVTVVTYSKTIYHNDDGTGSCYLYGEIKGPSGTSLAGVSVSGGDTVTLDTIPRSSTFECSDGELGSPLTFEISSESSSFTHTITYRCGNVSGSVCTKTTKTEVEWTPPLNLAQQATDRTTVPITYTLTAYNGSSVIGTDTLTVDCDIPDNVKPTVRAAVSDATACFGKYGSYVQSKSALKIKLTAAGVYGSTISSQQVTFDGKTYVGEENTTDAIKGSGKLQLVATVKDSRGRTAEAVVEVDVLAYVPPSVENMTVQRCNADGTRNASGEYLIAVFDATVTALNNRNSAAYAFQYKKSTGSAYSNVDISSLNGSYSVQGYSVIFAASKNDSYNVVLTITDDFGGIPKSTSGASQMTLLSRFTNGMGYAIGKIAERLGYLDMGFHIHMNGNRLHGLPAPTDGDDATPKSYVDAIKTSIESKLFPVGYIYMSVDKTSPAELFGGSWTQLTDRFLLGAGTTYTAGETGGAATHTLTIDEMPRHNHWGVYRPDWYLHGETGQASGVSDGASNNQLYTDKAGSSEAHNNMPPYLVVYMWKRIA